MNLLIDDSPELKIYDNQIDEKYLDVALTVSRGLKFLLENPVYETLYLDYNLIGAKGTDVLDWLKKNRGKIPNRIHSISFGAPDSFYQEIKEVLALKLG